MCKITVANAEDLNPGSFEDSSNSIFMYCVYIYIFIQFYISTANVFLILSLPVNDLFRNYKFMPEEISMTREKR